ncbi:MAG: hypothetical protein WC967_09400 [Balneolaceae bacterium]
MKRLQGKKIKLMDSPSNCLRRISVDKYKPFIFLPSENHFSNLYLNHLELTTELPYLDIYTVHSESIEGLRCGYCFDTAVTPVFGKNFLIAASNKITHDINDIGEANFIISLKIKIKTCNIYTMEGLASMITIGTDSKVREALEI